MSRVLVTGMSGTGKSSALAGLGRRGYRVVDTDDPDWREYREHVESSNEVRRGEWLWVEGRITELLDCEMVARIRFLLDREEPAGGVLSEPADRGIRHSTRRPSTG